MRMQLEFRSAPVDFFSDAGSQTESAPASSAAETRNRLPAARMLSGFWILPSVILGALAWGFVAVAIVDLLL